MADAVVLNTIGRKAVGVRLPSLAPAPVSGATLAP